MDNNVYGQFNTHFKSVSVYTILKDGAFVASISIKYPSRGEGKLWAYVRFYGSPMVRGGASGSGYDKVSAAVVSAVSKLVPPEWRDPDHDSFAIFETLQEALKIDGGAGWDQYLEGAGFTVHAII